MREKSDNYEWNKIPKVQKERDFGEELYNKSLNFRALRGISDNSGWNFVSKSKREEFYYKSLHFRALRGELDNSGWNFGNKVQKERDFGEIFTIET